MKVLGFVGSPRKNGNTDILVDTFLDGASSAGAEVKKFFLTDHTINQCMGCYRKCILNPGFRCGTFRDDMDLLLEEMVSSDLILFASPFYCSSYTAIMAKFLERCLPLWDVEIAGLNKTRQFVCFCQCGCFLAVPETEIRKSCTRSSGSNNVVCICRANFKRILICVII